MTVVIVVMITGKRMLLVMTMARMVKMIRMRLGSYDYAHGGDYDKLPIKG